MAGHNVPIVTVNSFLEDTSVLVAAAFLLVRGPFEQLLANPFRSGIVFGLLGASEALFPNARFPYASHTLACAFATAFVGWRAGVVAALITCAASLALSVPNVALITTIQVGVSILVIGLLPKPAMFKSAFTISAVVLAQSLAVLATSHFSPTTDSLRSPWTIVANPLGVILLALVVRDARARSDAEHHRQEVVDARRIATEAQLATLRTRVQPHFLYNALTSIAALCEIAPKRAAKATITLGALMRRSLESDFGKAQTLGQELETVKYYTDIELERFGQKLTVEFCVDGFENVSVPTLGVQILVENAILHGVGRLARDGHVKILARKNLKFAYVAVADDGMGLPPEGWRRDSPHGLTILEAQIAVQIGPLGRLRLMQRCSGGTIAVMRIPLEGGRLV